MAIAPLPKPPKKLVPKIAPTVGPKLSGNVKTVVTRHGPAIPKAPTVKPKLKGSVNLNQGGLFDDWAKDLKDSQANRPGGGSPVDRSTASFSSPGSSDATVPPEPEAPAAYTSADLIAKLKMFDSDPQLYKDLYGAISKSILAARDTQAADIETQRAATRKIYDDSTAMISQKLNEDKARLGAAGEGLGVNLNASVLSKDWDQNSLNQQISQEAYRGADEIYWDKAKQGGQDLFSMLNNSALLSGTNHEADLKKLIDTTNAGITSDANSQFSQYELARLAAEALAKSGGGGGGGGGYRRRSGGGSGGSGGDVYDTTAAGETSTLGLVGDEALYNELLKTDPAAASAYLRNINLNSGSAPLTGAQKALDDANAAYDRYSKIAGRSPRGLKLKTPRQLGGKAATAAENKRIAEEVLRYTTPLGGVMGNPKTTATVSTKANQRTYQKGVPYKTYLPAKAPAKAPAKGSAGRLGSGLKRK